VIGAELEREGREAGAESGCHKSRLERWAANRSHALITSCFTAYGCICIALVPIQPMQ